MPHVCMLLAASLASTTLLTGCAQSRDAKTVIQKGQYFVLQEDYRQHATRGPDQIQWVEGLSAGRYVAEAEDEKGVYYRGASGSVILLPQDAVGQSLRDDTIDPESRRDGGVWLPRNTVDRPRIYYFPWVRPLPGAGVQFGLKGAVFGPFSSRGFAWGPEITAPSFVQEIKFENQ